ncbi:CGNR zinc finger domain-containing protein [Saccharopolyspora gloriosae]|uniref:Putative RNA-binding Zn ribbon-like protein n=1 Tax=Saccharopolyspora gloriosae TaxID=455344 RepID=A0A840NI59_9PSEU|nr:CGNR zinc finger domain-containing protein [Saccharopolyspora gloriosae]MBB5071274.1 putative RNA-binding Zn ribbon-like protein [Saccharopolyspora gloriosae]
MDSADYTELALRLANADLTGLDRLRAALHDEPWWSQRVHEHDLEVLRTVATGLRAAFDAMIDGDAARVQAATNALLERHPPRPRLSGHGPSWHVHVAGPDAPPATEVAAAAAWGLAQGVVQHGTGRWGRCQAADCATYYLDTSTNQAKRFCSARCANRVHVAAFRARRKN